MKKFRTIATTTVALAVLASSISGCSMVKKLDTDAVMDATESLCGYMTSANYKKISKMVSEDLEEDDLSNIETYCNMTSDEDGVYVNAFLDSASYEVDEDSIEMDKKSGEITVTATFTIADVDSVMDAMPYDSVELACDAIADADEYEMNLEFVFVNEDDNYVLAEVDAVEDFYAYFADSVSDIEVVVPAASLTSDMVESADWWFANSDDTYENATSIDLELYFSSEVDVDEDDITYECIYDGTIIATGTGVDAWIHYYDCENIEFIEGEYFPEGEYTISFYYNGELFYADTTTVTYTGDGDVDVDIDIPENDYSFSSPALQALADAYDAQGYIVEAYDDAEVTETLANEGFMAADYETSTLVMAFSADDPQACLDWLIADADATNVQTTNGVTTFTVDGVDFVGTIDGDIVLLVAANVQA